MSDKKAYTLKRGYLRAGIEKHCRMDNWPPRDPTIEELWYMADKCREAGIIPLEVYVGLVGNKKYMIPISNMPKEIRPQPVEIVAINYGKTKRGR